MWTWLMIVKQIYLEKTVFLTYTYILLGWKSYQHCGKEIGDLWIVRSRILLSFHSFLFVIFVRSKDDMYRPPSPISMKIIGGNSLYRVLVSCWFHLCAFSKNSPNIQLIRFSLHKWRNSFTHAFLVTNDLSAADLVHVNFCNICRVGLLLIVNLW